MCYANLNPERFMQWVRALFKMQRLALQNVKYMDTSPVTSIKVSGIFKGDQQNKIISRVY